MIGCKSGALLSIYLISLYAYFSPEEIEFPEVLALVKLLQMKAFGASGDLPFSSRVGESARQSGEKALALSRLHVAALAGRRAPSSCLSALRSALLLLAA